MFGLWSSPAVGVELETARQLPSVGLEFRSFLYALPASIPKDNSSTAYDRSLQNDLSYPPDRKLLRLRHVIDRVVAI